jgi:hypothetical protein
MEMQDDAACKGRPDYTQCRKNLFAYRQQAVIDENQRQARIDRVADGLAAAGQALQNINPPPPPACERERHMHLRVSVNGPSQTD